MPRERTVKQQAVYHVLLRYDKPVKRTFVMPERATLRLPNLSVVRPRQAQDDLNEIGAAG